MLNYFKHMLNFKNLQLIKFISYNQILAIFKLKILCSIELPGICKSGSSNKCISIYRNHTKCANSAAFVISICVACFVAQRQALLSCNYSSGNGKWNGNKLILLINIQIMQNYGNKYELIYGLKWKLNSL